MFLYFYANLSCMYDGEKLKRLRMAKGYSQKGIAKKLGITQQAYSKLENRQTKINDARKRNPKSNAMPA
jgi:transcriptional regulator with XRE-family HTH domain